MDELDALLVQIMANHSPAARVSDQVVDHLSGGALGEEPVFASVSGYEESPDRIGPGAISLSTAGSPYFARGAVIDPCQSCTATTGRVGVDEGAFQIGVAPLQEP